MEFLNNSKGFTMISMLFSLTILVIALPFLTYLIKSAKHDSQYQELAIQHFFVHLRDDLITARTLSVTPQSIYFTIKHTDGSEETGSISQYKNLVRRQINQQGHEVYLRDIEQILFEKTAHGVKVIVSSLEGEQYEKIITLYKS